MGKIVVSYEFDYYEEQSELKELMAAQHARSALWDVDQELRSKLKYSEDEWMRNDKVQEYLEKLREMIWESGALRDD